MTDYERVKDEMFDKKLAAILDRMSGEQILKTGTAYEVFSEALKNQVLEELERDRKEDAYWAEQGEDRVTPTNECSYPTGSKCNCRVRVGARKCSC